MILRLKKAKEVFKIIKIDSVILKIIYNLKKYIIFKQITMNPFGSSK